MPTIYLKKEVKERLERLMLKKIHKKLNDPKVLVQAIKNKYGYTHSEFILNLIKMAEKRIKDL